MEGKEVEGLPRKRQSLGGLEQEPSQPPGDGLEERGGGVLPEIKERMQGD